MNISKSVKQFQNQLPPQITLVAISKQKNCKTILEAYNAGQKIFGENRTQELVKKTKELPKDICWHMVGHLQTNKVKSIVPFVDCIHSVDSLKLLKTINKEALKMNRIVHCLLQIHIAEESRKFGFKLDELTEILASEEWKEFTNVRLCGLMGMATFISNKEQVRKEFRRLKNFFDFLKQEFFHDDAIFKEISMGMSGDYKIAIEEGATMLRIGSLIFGERLY